MAAELEVITAAVTGALTGGAVKPVLAPADALAEHWREKVRARLARVGESVHRKSGRAAQIVNERVAYRVLSDAAFTDDPVVLEYLAGVVAGSPIDSDEGTPALAQIARLSGFQLRVHYVIYREVLAVLKWSDAGSPRIFLAQSGLEDAFNDSFQCLRPRLEVAGDWLRREGLLLASDSGGRPGNREGFRIMTQGEHILTSREWSGPIVHSPSEGGLLVTPTDYGLDLFLWGCGSPRSDRRMLPELSPSAVELEPPIPPCVGRAVSELPETPYEEFVARRQAGEPYPEG
jgi:hypothetical protein